MPVKPTKSAQSTAVAPYNWSQVGVSGFENVSQQDLGIPFLAILQKGSPQVDAAHPEHAAKKIEGAKPGDIVNTLTNARVYEYGKNPLLFVPCGFERLFVEWTPREKGGGIVKVHKDQSILMETRRNQRGNDELKNGNILVTTAYFFGIALIGDMLNCIIGMSSTQLKKSRMWLNMMMALKLDGPQGKFTPPMFSHRYAITTIPENNEKGNWYGWQIRISGPVSEPDLIKQAIETAKLSYSSNRVALPPPSDEETSRVY